MLDAMKMKKHHGHDFSFVIEQDDYQFFHQFKLYIGRPRFREKKVLLLQVIKEMDTNEECYPLGWGGVTISGDMDFVGYEADDLKRLAGYLEKMRQKALSLEKKYPLGTMKNFSGGKDKA